MFFPGELEENETESGSESHDGADLAWAQSK